MPRDQELDRLKAAQDAAFSRKQAAYQAQQRAWEDRRRAGDALNVAFQAKQGAYDAQQSAWTRYQSIRSANGPQIDSLKMQSDQAHRNMQNAYQNANDAYGRRDGAGAKSYSEQGKAFRSERDGLNGRVRMLIGEIQSAKTQLSPYQQAFQATKAEFARAKERFAAAKAMHLRYENDFKMRRAEFTAAQAAFKTRLAYVREQRARDRGLWAEKAGVPFQYRNNVHVSVKPDGTVNVYFGGVGTPDGPGHGHYVLSPSGTVTYRRDPFDPHGAHNFTSNQADYFDAVRTESVSGTGEFSFNCRYKGLPAMVETGIDNKTGRQKIDIYYGGRGGPLGPGHGHAVAYRNDPYGIVTDRSPS